MVGALTKKKEESGGVDGLTGSISLSLSLSLSYLYIDYLLPPPPHFKCPI